MLETTVEWAPFTLAAGATEAELLAAADAVQREFLAERPGFVRRELLRGEGGRWCDLLHWTDPGAAHRASAEAAESAICHRYFELMGPPPPDGGAGMLYFTQVRSYAPAAAGAGRG